MTEARRRSGLVFAALGLAIAVVAAILFWPADDGEPRAAAGSGASSAGGRSGSEGGPTAAGGVAARSVTTAAVGRVEADVVDASGEPVGGATVVLRCLLPGDEVRGIASGIVRTDDDGHLEGPGCRGLVCADLRHTGLVPAEPWTLDPERPVILRARVLSQLRGEVVDERGEPVAAATIAVARDPDDDDPRAVLPVTTSTTGTDADGAFSLALVGRPPCDPCAAAAGECHEGPLPIATRVLLVARAPGFGPAQTIVDIDAPDEVRLVLPAPQPGLSGTVRDPEGRAYPRSFVLARSIARPSEQHRGGAGEGEFEVVDLGEGEYGVRAIQDGIELATAGPVGPGDRVDLVGPPIVAELVLEIVDEGDRPQPGLRVDGGPWARATTDDEGRVTAEGVATGTYVVRVKRPGLGGRTHSLTVGPAGAATDDATGSQADAAGSPPGPRQILRIRVPGPAKR